MLLLLLFKENEDSFDDENRFSPKNEITVECNTKNTKLIALNNNNNNNNYNNNNNSSNGIHNNDKNDDNNDDDNDKSNMKVNINVNSIYRMADSDQHENKDKINELNFKGIVIGGTYQHCFEDDSLVIHFSPSLLMNFLRNSVKLTVYDIQAMH